MQIYYNDIYKIKVVNASKSKNQIQLKITGLMQQLTKSALIIILFVEKHICLTVLNLLEATVAF